MNAASNPGQFRPVQPGPQVGAPPSLEQVPLDRLQVDPAYQRATDGAQSGRIIRGMVKEWNWALCQPLAVARRADGSLFVLDGQHRLQGARERGDIHYLPCVITSGLDLAGEARTFVNLNTARQKLSESDVFVGMLAAGDEHAVKVQAIMEATGWRLARTKNVAAWKPGQLLCGPMLVKMLKARGENAVCFALSILRAAYPETPVTVAATLLAALGEAFEDHAMCELTAADLAQAIGALKDPRRWRIRAEKRRERFPGESMQTALAQSMLAAAKGQPDAAIGHPATDKPTPTYAPGTAHPVTTRLPTPSTGHSSIAARTGAAQPYDPATRTTRVTIPAKSPFGTEGKGWCDQCDQLRSKAYAASCTDRFCKLRAFA